MFDIINYFRTIATQLKEISHSEKNKRFYRTTGPGDMIEFLNNLRYASGTLMVVEYNHTGRFVDNHGDTLADQRDCTFYLLRKAKLNDQGELEELYSGIKIISRKIVSRLRKDVRERTIPPMQLGNTMYYNIGPVADNYYGIAFDMPVPEELIQPYNASDWLTDGQ